MMTGPFLGKPDRHAKVLVEFHGGIDRAMDAHARFPECGFARHYPYRAEEQAHWHEVQAHLQLLAKREVA